MSFIDYIGFVPAIVFPTATLIQLIFLIKTKSSEGVSALAWAAFAIGNVSLYIYTEKYTQIQSIIGLLVPSILQIGIIFLALKYRKKSKVIVKP
ncbi:hypothetical protein [Thalassotalea fusca]